MSIARLVAVSAALSLASCDYYAMQFGVQTGPVALLACHGDFAQFRNGFMVARPMELNFVVDWLAPSVVPVEGGGPAKIIALSSLELTFEIPYEGYKAVYRVNRVDSTISQRPNLGGVFSGYCGLRPYTTNF